MPDAELLAAVREKRPLVHCISNIVTANDCANILYAAGASPMMAEAVEEMAEITALADSTVLNLGTPSGAKYAAARVCAQESVRLGKPFVLDPVGVGASEWRLSSLSELLFLGTPDILRVNLSEAEAILGLGSREQGVDSLDHAFHGSRRETAAALAEKLGTTVLLTGKVDVVAGGGYTETVEGGSDLMPLITGSGCMLSALCGAFAAVTDDMFAAALAASRFWKRCSERAESMCSGLGPGSLRAALMDAAYAMSREN